MNAYKYEHHCVLTSLEHKPLLRFYTFYKGKEKEKKKSSRIDEQINWDQPAT